MKILKWALIAEKAYQQLLQDSLNMVRLKHKVEALSAELKDTSDALRIVTSNNNNLTHNAGMLHERLAEAEKELEYLRKEKQKFDQQTDRDEKGRFTTKPTDINFTKEN